MITRADIEDAVHDWIDAATGSAPVIIADQGKPRPAPPYLTIKLGALVGLGHDEDRGLTDPGAPSYAEQTYRGQREISVSVQAFGAGALDLARDAARALRTETTRSQLATAALYHRGAMPTINELTELLETDFEERAQFDVTLGFAEEYTDDVPLIERVQGTGTFENPPVSDRDVTFDVQKP